MKRVILLHSNRKEFKQLFGKQLRLVADNEFEIIDVDDPSVSEIKWRQNGWNRRIKFQHRTKRAKSWFSNRIKVDDDFRHLIERVIVLDSTTYGTI